MKLLAPILEMGAYEALWARPGNLASRSFSGHSPAPSKRSPNRPTFRR